MNISKMTNYEQGSGFDSGDASMSIRESEINIAINATKQIMNKKIADNIADIKANTNVSPTSVNIEDTVVVLYADGETEELVLVEQSCNQNERTVTLSSPLGQQIYGKNVGDKVKYELPDGNTEEITIIDITKNTKKVDAPQEDKNEEKPFTRKLVNK